MTPNRIQRKRTRGWEMPPNTKSVTRPGKWGNLFKVVRVDGCYRVWSGIHGTFVGLREFNGEVYDPRLAAKEAVQYYRDYAVASTLDFSELKGYDLACFCKEGDPCHADVLLELANQS